MAGSRAKEEFEQFERRAALAEEQIQLLSKRVELLEKGLLAPQTTTTAAAVSSSSSSSSSATDVAEYQKDLLSKLKRLEDTLEQERQQAEAAIKQREEAQLARKALEKENAANEYRIKILLLSLKEVEERNALLEAQLRAQ